MMKMIIEKKISKNQKKPKVLITTSHHPSAKTHVFVVELMEIITSSLYYERKSNSLKEIVEFGKKNEFSDILVFCEDFTIVSGMLHVHMPDGPTALFRLFNLKFSKDIEKCGRTTSQCSELMLKNFRTKLGRKIGHMFLSLFQNEPQYNNREVVTFYNQKDFIFFRHHRYFFNDKYGDKNKENKKLPITTKVQLYELGPRFTLKLESLQNGILIDKLGEYEFLRNPGLEANRKHTVI